MSDTRGPLEKLKEARQHLTEAYYLLCQVAVSPIVTSQDRGSVYAFQQVRDGVRDRREEVEQFILDHLDALVAEGDGV